MRTYSFVLAAVMASATCGAAVAQVPRLDVEKTCHAAQPLFGNEDTTAPTKTANGGNLGNSGETDTYQNCMQSESAAKKSSAELWSKVDAADRGNCVGLSRMVYPSYVELLSCLQMYDPTATGNPPVGQPAPRARTPQNRPL